MEILVQGSDFRCLLKHVHLNRGRNAYSTILQIHVLSINMTVHKTTMNTGRVLSFLSTLGGCKLHQSIGEFVFLTYVPHRVDLSYMFGPVVGEGSRWWKPEVRGIGESIFILQCGHCFRRPILVGAPPGDTKRHPYRPPLSPRRRHTRPL